MDPEFSDVAMTIILGDLDGLAAALDSEPGWATRISSCGHRTLLQFVACDAANLPDAAGAAKLLVDAGSDVAGPLVAAAGCDSTMQVLRQLLDHASGVDGELPWTPLDEAIYWDNTEIVDLLISLGARLHTLRTAAGIGRLDAIDGFFNDGVLAANAGPIMSPFVETVPADRADNAEDIIDNAFVTAVNGGHLEAARALVERGARVNATPPGFHWKGTALHAACWRGNIELVEWLLSIGADRSIRDGLADSDAHGWAEHHAHPEVAALLAP